jgi:toxin YhaV
VARTKRSKATSTSEAPSGALDGPLVVNGWQIFAHDLLLAQLARLIAAVEREAQRHPDAYKSSANAKLLAALATLMFEAIPADPTLAVYRQGKTLGPDMRHWFRAKFGRQRFRLFFRFRSEEKIVVYAWVNDAETLRTYGSKTDAYAVFRSMIESGNPPNDWSELLKSSKRTAGDFARIGPFIRRFE